MVQVVQQAADSLVVESVDGTFLHTLQPRMQVAGVDVTASHLAIWNGKQAQVHRPHIGHWRRKRAVSSPCLKSRESKETSLEIGRSRPSGA